MPTCGKHWEFDQNRYPKDKYWDKIQPITGASVIHFLDVPSLSNFDCPDTSHLDARDAPVFTQRLADEIYKITANRSSSNLFASQP
jgi:hypothetical protein